VARTRGVVPRIDEEDKSRGDGHLYFHTQSAIYDTYVIDPCAKNYVKCAQQPLGASMMGEGKKISLWRSLHTTGILIFSCCSRNLGVRCRDLVSMIEEEGNLNGVKNLHGMKIRSIYFVRSL
jgi:hypothetical protein